ncbi:uncharacterized protein MONBRDRAFT_30615 [Monosiga brevicollis MX1]|uniref:Receptor L-domain domain-containing protein n=1 Tax=Monosiga brevicollis TaxID=81824 RepID=A9VEG0_MONBE|nr:uncharacterized protein MONBRDRAFT_30615 [Monosiga brevicollis MX1]EDQ84081.1 predicted protein [Monosiga brevicollis MX1]|eukprot:XP_001751107.1 hypothetical protein [Monosiga brevicollis MX1]
MLSRWVVYSLRVVMNQAVIYAALVKDEPIIGIDVNGNLFINTSSTGNGRLLLNGVDVIQELTESRQMCAGTISKTTTLPPTTTTATTTAITTAAPTDLPVTYSGTIGCELENVPSNVAYVMGNVRLTSCPLLTANDLLQVFRKLVQVSGDLKFDLQKNDALTNVNGLATLTSVGGYLYINSNDALANVDGLGSVASVGGHLHISGNAVLTNVDGLGNITSVGGYLYINNNDGLTNVDGLGSITSVDGYLKIEDNDALTNMDGLGSITSVAGDLNICSNSQLDTSMIPASVRSLGTCQLITSGGCSSC